MRLSAFVVALLFLVPVLPGAEALPTPGLFCEPADMALGRLFPEAMQTNDFISYDEALCGLAKLEANHQQWITRDVVTESVGWKSLTGGHDRFEVYVVRVTDHESAVAYEDKIRLVFQLSIHGNEKGGREGGLRVIEDLVRDIGFSKTYPELRERLDHMELLFIFPNPDGWIHEEVDYRLNDACYLSLTCEPGETGIETQSFVRVNGNGVDLNRQWPTSGWVRERNNPMTEPEIVPLVDYLAGTPNIRYSSDIHGMLNPADGSTPMLACVPGDFPDPVGGFDATCFGNAVTGSSGHFVLSMLPAGRQDPRVMAGNTDLAEMIRKNMESNPAYAAWSMVPSAAGAWGGGFNNWGTVWDTIGYTDSGFTGDWYAQRHGLGALGVSFELSYNHITFDNYYPGVAQLMNAYHVEIVRDIVRSFMDHAAEHVDVEIQIGGTRTAWLDNPTVVTKNGEPSYFGEPFAAAPADHFRDLKPSLRDGAALGVLDMLTPAELATSLAGYDNLVIAGSAYRGLAGDETALAAVRAWVEAGGNLVLTDEALQMLGDLGVVPAAAIKQDLSYSGHTNFVDRDSALAANVRGLGRMTFEPVPLGFAINGLNAPVWHVTATAFQGEVVGLAGDGQGARANADKVNYGRAAIGAGTVTFLGALLPDPVADEHVRFALDSYATTYTGNQLLRNMLGWEEVVVKGPVRLGSESQTVEPAAADPESPIPMPAFAALLGVLGVVAMLRRRG